MSRSFYAWLMASLWVPGLIVGVLTGLVSSSPQVHLTVDGFIPIVSILVTLVGLSLSILIVVYTAIYVYARMKRESGFNQFLSSSSGLIELTQSVHRELNDNPVRQQSEYYLWVHEAEGIMDRLRTIGP